MNAGVLALMKAKGAGKPLGARAGRSGRTRHYGSFHGRRGYYVFRDCRGGSSPAPGRHAHAREAAKMGVGGWA